MEFVAAHMTPQQKEIIIQAMMENNINHKFSTDVDELQWWMRARILHEDGERKGNRNNPRFVPPDDTQMTVDAAPHNRESGSDEDDEPYVPKKNVFQELKPLANLGFAATLNIGTLVIGSDGEVEEEREQPQQPVVKQELVEDEGQAVDRHPLGAPDAETTTGISGAGQPVPHITPPPTDPTNTGAEPEDVKPEIKPLAHAKSVNLQNQAENVQPAEEVGRNDEGMESDGDPDLPVFLNGGVSGKYDAVKFYDRMKRLRVPPNSPTHGRPFPKQEHFLLMLEDVKPSLMTATVKVEPQDDEIQQVELNADEFMDVPEFNDSFESFGEGFGGMEEDDMGQEEAPDGDENPTLPAHATAVPEGEADEPVEERHTIPRKRNRVKRDSKGRDGLRTKGPKTPSANATERPAGRRSMRLIAKREEDKETTGYHTASSSSSPAKAKKLRKRDVSSDSVPGRNVGRRSRKAGEAISRDGNDGALDDEDMATDTDIPTDSRSASQSSVPAEQRKGRKRKAAVKPPKPPVDDCTCPVANCGASFSDYEGLTDHIKAWHSTQLVPCDECTRMFGSTRALTMHKRRAHGAPKKTAAMKRNEQLKKKTKVYDCDICCDQYHTLSAYDQHMATKHGIGEPKMFECEVCGKGFKSAAHMEDHKAVHAGIHRHSCQKCKKDFAYKSQLYHHLKNHAD